MHAEIFIYGLVCPISQGVKYVGKTKYSLKSRLGRHLSAKHPTSKKDKWIFDLKKDNLTPSIVLLESTFDKRWEKHEKKWILHFGIENLLNENLGGAGGRNGNDNRYLDLLKSKLLESKSKNTTRNYLSCIGLFLKYHSFCVSPSHVNAKQVLEYLTTIKNINSRKLMLTSLKFFYKEIISQPNKLKFIKYEYR